MRQSTVHRFDDILRLLEARGRILCLYSGGLDGSYLLTQLAHRRHGDVIPLGVDLGGEPPSEAAFAVCQQLGIEWLRVDRRQEFVTDFVAPSIPAHACYLGNHPICASLSRPLMAKAACEMAAETGCTAIVHTADRSQNSLRRFNGAIASLGFQGDFGSPFATSAVPREEKMRALSAAGISGFENRVHSFDSNLWGWEFESGSLDDPEQIHVPDHLYRQQRNAGEPRNVAIAFQSGMPIAIDGRSMELTELISRLNDLGSCYRLGRYVGLEEIESGAKVQEVREMPAAFILFDAYRRIESATVASETIREKLQMEQVWVREAVEGRWFEPLRKAAQAFIQEIARSVTGAIEYELSDRALRPVSLRAEAPLYVRNRDRLIQRAAVSG